MYASTAGPHLPAVSLHSASPSFVNTLLQIFFHVFSFVSGFPSFTHILSRADPPTPSILLLSQLPFCPCITFLLPLFLSSTSFWMFPLHPVPLTPFFPVLSSVPRLESAILRSNSLLHRWLSSEPALHNIAPLFNSTDFVCSFSEEQSPAYSHFTERRQNPYWALVKKPVLYENPEGCGIYVQKNIL